MGRVVGLGRWRSDDGMTSAHRPYERVFADDC